MLDLRVIRQNPEKISENCRNRNLPDLVAPLLEQDELARSLKRELDTLRQRRNEISNQMKSKLSKDERLLQNIFSLISISALFSEENKNKRISFPIYLFILIISLPIRFLRSIIYKII